MVASFSHSPPVHSDDLRSDSHKPILSTEDDQRCVNYEVEVDKAEERLYVKQRKTEMAAKMKQLQEEQQKAKLACEATTRGDVVVQQPTQNRRREQIYIPGSSESYEDQSSTDAQHTDTIS